MVSFSDSLLLAGVPFGSSIKLEQIIFYYRKLLLNQIRRQLYRTVRKFRTVKTDIKISELGFVSLKVYNALGIEVADLVNEMKSAGKHTVSFDGSNFPSGVYFYKLSVTGRAGVFTETKRMVLLK